MIYALVSCLIWANGASYCTQSMFGGPFATLSECKEMKATMEARVHVTTNSEGTRNNVYVCVSKPTWTRAD
jgi:hypothetical protein